MKALAYRISSRAFLLAALIALTGLVAGSAADDAAAATVEVGGKRGFKTIATALARAKPGDVVLIKPGTYPGGFRITRNVVVRAEPGAQITLGPKQAITVKGVGNVELIGLAVSSTAKAGDKPHINLLNITGSRKVVLRNCQISVAGGWGVIVNDSRDVTVEKCQINGSGKVGITLGGERLLLRKTTVTGLKFGVHITKGKGIVVANNLIDANNTGVYVAGGKVDIIGNTINGPGYAGIYLRGGDVAVAANAVRRFQYGVYTRAGGGGLIAGNTLGQNKNSALVVGGPAYKVRRNTISYNAGNGILVWYKEDGAWPGGKRAVISQNVISSNQGSGVAVTAGGEILVRQNLLENNVDGLLMGKSVVEAAHNTIVLNTYSGIRATAGSEIKLRKNIIANNQNGIVAHADAKLRSENNVIFGHIFQSGFQLFDTNHTKDDWLPTLGGDEVLVKVIPARDLRAPGDLYIDPGFVKLGTDYRLRLGSELLKRLKMRPLPGAFPTVGAVNGATRR